ncbi:MAG: type II toxin-antitoxin system PemK/MazF family toxin [Parachlamydiales bacterium]
MTLPIATYRQFDVVSVPFPFTDLLGRKRRPAVIISSNTLFNDHIQHCVLAMVTSKIDPSWPLDIRLTDYAAVGLSVPSIIRMKFLP